MHLRLKYGCHFRWLKITLSRSELDISIMLDFKPSKMTLVYGEIVKLGFPKSNYRTQGDGIMKDTLN